MRKTAFTTVGTARNSNDAEHIIAVLRDAGLHPADLAVTTPLVLPGARSRFPIQVPAEETEPAKEVLEHATTFKE